MKLRLKITLLLFCVVQLVLCVPLKNSNDSTNDPCDLEELGSIPKCDADDKNCDDMNVEKRAKRQTLCEKNPNCSYCGSLIPGWDDKLPSIVDPEIIELVTIDSGNSTDGIEQEIKPDELKAPPKLIERNIIIENDNETQYFRGYIESGSNITTIIRLTNLINNTNIVNMPTTLNNTNINNIHVYQNKTKTDGGKFGLGFNEDGSCCFLVGPKSCKKSTTGTKCRHKKTKVCGPQCVSKMIQPDKTPCNYSPQWPYVVCPNGKSLEALPQFYQPPPQFYPPAFYPPPNYYPQQPPPNEFDDDDDLPLFPDDDLLENPESGWVVGPEKCKVVSEDGLQILNCTQKGINFEHPFAKNTENVKRETRQATYHSQPYQPYQNPQQNAYYPIMYQPILMQPVYMPQYYLPPPPPPPMSYYQSQQIPLPPVEPYHYDNDQETNEISNPYQQPKKRGKKHHPVIIDNFDEEL